jgi:hypothetical protein
MKLLNGNEICDRVPTFFRLDRAGRHENRKYDSRSTSGRNNSEERGRTGSELKEGNSETKNSAEPTK